MSQTPTQDAGPLSDPVLEAFDQACGQLHGFDPKLDAEWLDGYFTALLAGRRTVVPSEWMPKALGDSFGRAFGDPQAAQQGMQSLMARWNQIASALDPEALMDAPEELRLNPLMAQWDDEDRQRVKTEAGLSDEDARSLQTGALWAQGFFDAVEDFAGDWPDPDPDADDAQWHEASMADLAMLLLDPHSDAYAEHLRARFEDVQTDPPTRDDLIDAALFAAQELRLYWLDHGPRPEQRRVGPTPGRNDPCPCGSGRKYKKCHGAG